MYAVNKLAFAVMPPPISVRIAAAKNYMFGEPELRHLAALVPRGGTSIDVGAHRGVYTYFLSRLSDRVIAYEPNADLASYLRSSVRSNVIVREVALGDREGNAYLSIPRSGHRTIAGWGKISVAPGDHSCEVAIATLDHERLSDVRFIKIDTEGTERAVLLGAQGTIRRDFPVLLVEIEQRHLSQPITDLFRLITALGYRGFFLRGSKWQCLDQFSPDRDQALCNADGKGSLYVNNFLFWPDARGMPEWMV